MVGRAARSNPHSFAVGEQRSSKGRYSLPAEASFSEGSDESPVTVLGEFDMAFTSTARPFRGSLGRKEGGGGILDATDDDPFAEENIQPYRVSESGFDLPEATSRRSSAPASGSFLSPALESATEFSGIDDLDYGYAAPDSDMGYGYAVPDTEVQNESRNDAPVVWDDTASTSYRTAKASQRRNRRASIGTFAFDSNKPARRTSIGLGGSMHAAAESNRPARRISIGLAGGTTTMQATRRSSGGARAMKPVCRKSLNGSSTHAMNPVRRSSNGVQGGSAHSIVVNVPTRRRGEPLDVSMGSRHSEFGSIHKGYAMSSRHCAETDYLFEDGDGPASSSDDEKSFASDDGDDNDGFGQAEVKSPVLSARLKRSTSGRSLQGSKKKESKTKSLLDGTNKKSKRNCPPTKRHGGESLQKHRGSKSLNMEQTLNDEVEGEKPRRSSSANALDSLGDENDEKSGKEHRRSTPRDSLDEENGEEGKTKRRSRKLKSLGDSTGDEEKEAKPRRSRSANALDSLGHETDDKSGKEHRPPRSANTRDSLDEEKEGDGKKKRRSRSSKNYSDSTDEEQGAKPRRSRSANALDSLDKEKEGDTPAKERRRSRPTNARDPLDEKSSHEEKKPREHRSANKNDISDKKDSDRTAALVSPRRRRGENPANSSDQSSTVGTKESSTESPRRRRVPSETVTTKDPASANLDKTIGSESPRRRRGANRSEESGTVASKDRVKRRAKLALKNPNEIVVDPPNSH